MLAQAPAHWQASQQGQRANSPQASIWASTTIEEGYGGQDATRWEAVGRHGALHQPLPVPISSDCK